MEFTLNYIKNIMGLLYMLMNFSSNKKENNNNINNKILIPNLIGVSYMNFFMTLPFYYELNLI
uniref:Uncharacterized protein n=1 Tax=Rhizophora mucronata TaxID=61149 RepID=A0A2P2NE31_RHIMU